MNMWMALADATARSTRLDERESIGWVAIGMVIGALLVIGLIVKLLIPGD